MNLRKALVAAALGGAMGLPGAASALTIDGITFTEGAIVETIDLFEGKLGGGPIQAVGDQLVGVGRVNVIRDLASNVVLWDRAGIDAPNNGRELTVYFHSYIAREILTIGSDVQINFSGGIVEIYSDDINVDGAVVGDTTKRFNATAPLTQAQSIATASDGNLWLSLAGSPIGALAGANEFVGGNAITLRSIGSSLTGAGAEIDGRGLLDVTGGPAAPYFDTNQFGCESGVDADPAACPNDADKTFTSEGQLNVVNPIGALWAFNGTGTVTDVAVIPEPGTLALLGAGLMGLGMRRRKVA